MRVDGIGTIQTAVAKETLDGCRMALPTSLRSLRLRNLPTGHPVRRAAQAFNPTWKEHVSAGSQHLSPIERGAAVNAAGVVAGGSQSVAGKLEELAGAVFALSFARRFNDPEIGRAMIRRKLSTPDGRLDKGVVPTYIAKSGTQPSVWSPAVKRRFDQGVALLGTLGNPSDLVAVNLTIWADNGAQGRSAQHTMHLVANQKTGHYIAWVW